MYLVKQFKILFRKYISEGAWNTECCHANKILKSLFNSDKQCNDYNWFKFSMTVSPTSDVIIVAYFKTFSFLSYLDGKATGKKLSFNSL